MKLCFGISDLEGIGYTDADFAGDVDDRKSTSGHVRWNSCLLVK